MPPSFTQVGNTCVVHAATNSRLPRSCTLERYLKVMRRVLCEMNQSVRATTGAKKDATFDWRDGEATSLAFAAAPERSLRRGQYCMANWQTSSRADTN